MHISAFSLVSQDKITPAPEIQQAAFTQNCVSDKCTVSFTHHLADAEAMREFVCSLALEQYKTVEAMKNSPEAYLLSPTELYLQLSENGTQFFTAKKLSSSEAELSAEEILKLLKYDKAPNGGIMLYARILLASADSDEDSDKKVYIFAPSESMRIFITSDGLILPEGIPLVFPEKTQQNTALPLPSRAGYTFDGWSADNDKRINVIPEGTKEITLRTHWIPKVYEINYHITTRSDMNFTFVGANNSLNPVSYTVGTEQLINPLTSPDARFFFDGWYYESDFSGEKVSAIKPGETGDKVLYAKWVSLEESELEKRKQREEYIKEKKFGDVDSDGEVTANDARMVLRMVVGLDYADPELLRRAALDGKSTVSSMSARTLLRISVGLDDMYEILLENGLLP